MALALTLRAALPPAPRGAGIFAVAPESLTDAELIDRVGQGDHGAFELLYRRYARSVFGLALRRLGDRGRAEDAVQEAFASIWRSAGSETRCFWMRLRGALRLRWRPSFTPIAYKATDQPNPR